MEQPRPALLALFLCAAGLLAPAHGQGQCDDVFLGPNIGWVSIFNYNDGDGSCTLSMEELNSVCTGEHYAQCLRFLQSSGSKSKDGAECGDQEMMQNMNSGGDVCCDYTDGRLCGTFPVTGIADSAEECVDTGHVTTDSDTLRMPMRRNCDRWVVAIRFPHANFPRNCALDEAYVVLPIHPQVTQVRHQSRHPELRTRGRL